LTLMKFADVDERNKNLGPLYAGAAEESIPVFGSNRFVSPKIASALDAEIRKSLDDLEGLMVDNLTTNDMLRSQIVEQGPSAIDSVRIGASKLKLSNKDSSASLKSKTPAAGAPTRKSYSSRELHDKLHYSMQSQLPGSKSVHKDFAHTSLNRALAGYLFDCELNKKVVAEDPWLKGVWEWVAGMLYIYSYLPDIFSPIHRGSRFRQA
jgi:hypothetical protein